MPNRNPSSKTTPPYEGTPTPGYYGFHDAKIRRTDWKYSEGMKGNRAVEYPKPSEKVERVKQTLQDKGLVLGRPLETTSPKTERYAIPNSAHPIKHDTGSTGFSSFRYNDTARFYDLGVILGQVARADSTVYELQGGIGQNIAEVEFTAVAERRLFLVPGFEHYLTPSPEGHEAVLLSYAQRLNDEFGSRFVQHIDQFAEGFDS